MKILVALLASLSVAPAAEALTWKEFWEPFVEYSNHYHHEVYHYHDHEYHPPRRWCWEERYVKEKVYIPGHWGHDGFYHHSFYDTRTTIKKIRVRCRY